MIAIISDSHDNLPALRQMVAIFNELSCSLVIHAGDFVAPFAARELRRLRCPLRAVFGNCDGEKQGLITAIEGGGLIQDAPYEFSVEGLKIHLRHIPLAPETDSIARSDIDVYIFGHTHKPSIASKGPLLILNPGEAGGWLTGKSSYLLLDPKTKKATLHYL
ncbi:MAG: hypothetical protein B5M54_01520 [Candidatus Aminicenantes bacterium 4484_214]|nr:MAG: hypothetical protein B5M54_01520 [Candidatus Aminicenantes bacterium 4484_214]